MSALYSSTSKSCRQIAQLISSNSEKLVVPRYIADKMVYNFNQAADMCGFVVNKPKYAQNMQHMLLSQQQWRAN